MTDIYCVGSGVKYQTRAFVFTRNKHATVSRRMEAAGFTPTKSFSRLSFIPKSKIRSGPILAASIHSLLRGRAQIGPNTVCHASAAVAARFGRNAD